VREVREVRKVREVREVRKAREEKEATEGERSKGSKGGERARRAGGRENKEAEDRSTYGRPVATRYSVHPRDQKSEEKQLLVSATNSGAMNAAEPWKPYSLPGPW
jgi:hypothetical protein